MHKLDYPITLRPLAKNDGGGWLAEVPDLPGCVADGATAEAAMREAADAARSWMRTAKAHGDPIPEPSPAVADYSGRWLLRAPKGLHKRLAERAKAEGVSLNTLAVSLLAQGLGERSGSSR